VAETSLNYRSRLPRAPKLCKPPEIFAPRNPSSGLLRTYPNIISHEIAENTNKPLINKPKNYKAAWHFSCSLLFQRPGTEVKASLLMM